jgi:hypothetical protein
VSTPTSASRNARRSSALSARSSASADGSGSVFIRTGGSPLAGDRRLERRSDARCRDGRVDRPASDRGGDAGSSGRTRGWGLASPGVSPGGLINAGQACTGPTHRVWNATGCSRSPSGPAQQANGVATCEAYRAPADHEKYLSVALVIERARRSADRAGTIG